MFHFDYFRANHIEEVCSFLQQHGDKSRILAGGTDLMVQIHEKDPKWAQLEWVVDISALQKELRYVREEETEVHIGALSTHTDLETSPVIQEYFPLLSAACASVGSPQIRNMGTIGGSTCNASPAADPLTPLIACDASIVLQGVDGRRTLLLSDFLLGKGQVDLQPGEFVVEFVVPKLPCKAVTRFEKLGRRKALAISRLNAAVVLKYNEQKEIEFARVVAGCIFTKPKRLTEVENLLVGKTISRELFEQAGKAVSEEMIRVTGYRWSTEYKQPALEGLMERALLTAAEMELE